MDDTKQTQHDCGKVEHLFDRYRATWDPDLARQVCDLLESSASARARQLVERIRNTTDDDHLRQIMAELEHTVHPDCAKVEV
jgi:hypothetical protein